MVNWYCLFCTPQKEFLTKRVLKDVGLDSIVPREFRYIKRKGRFKTRVTVKAYPLLGSRYIFVEAPAFPFAQLRGLHMVTGTVYENGEPAVFTEQTVKALDRISERPYNSSIDRTTLHKTFRLGEAVRITQGAFEGHISRIVEVRRGSLRVFIALLGGVQAVWLTADQVEHP